jgi:hypothetical protein
MSSEELTTEDGDVPDDVPVDDETARTAELEVLREENRRLREEFAAAKRTQYRQTALLLVGVGLLAAVAGVLFPNARNVLLALGGTGVFVGVLTYYLTPEQFLPASVGRDVYTALAGNEADLVTELGLQDATVYVPLAEGAHDVRLFVPQHADYTIPDGDALGDVFVVTDAARERGVSLEPTGATLFAEFQRALTGDLGDDAATLAAQLTDALVEQFELVGSAETEVDADDGRVTIGVTDSTYGPVDQFDHPLVSVLAVGIAQGLERSVTTEVEASDDERVDYRITCRWETGDDED